MQLQTRFIGKKHRELNTDQFDEILSRAFSRFQNHIEAVRLFLEDVNGPRGGVDKQCCCVLQMKGMKPIVIRDRDEELSTMVYRVANRASHALRKNIDRLQSRSRKRHSRDSQMQVM